MRLTGRQNGQYEMAGARAPDSSPRGGSGRMRQPRVHVCYMVREIGNAAEPVCVWLPTVTVIEKGRAWSVLQQVAGPQQNAKEV